MATVTTNDLLVYNSGTWTSPSEIRVFDTSGNTFVNVSNVYVYKSGWVQSWPPITSNVTVNAVGPEYVLTGSNGTDDQIYFANLTGNNWGYIGMSGFYGARKTEARPAGYTSSGTEAMTDLVIMGGNGSNNKLQIYGNLATTAANTTEYSEPTLHRDYTLSSGTKINSFCFIQEDSIGVIDDFPSASDRVHLKAVGQGGKIFKFDNVYSYYGGWPTSLSYSAWTLSSSANLTYTDTEHAFGANGTILMWGDSDSAHPFGGNVPVYDYDGSASAAFSGNALWLMDAGTTHNFNDASPWGGDLTTSIYYTAANTGKFGCFLKTGGSSYVQANFIDFTSNISGNVGSTNLNSIRCFNPLYWPHDGIIVGDNGLIITFKLSGTFYGSWTMNYQVRTSGTTNNLRSIAALESYGSPVEIIVVGDNGTILRSTTNGNTWSNVSSISSTTNWTSVDLYQYPGFWEARE